MTDGNDTEDILESMDTSLLHYQQTVRTTQDKRYTALERLEPLLATATMIEDGEKPSTIEAKMNIVNTYTTLLDKIDKASHTKAITSMKKQENESRADEGKQVVAFMQQLAGKPDPFQDRSLDNISHASDAVDQRTTDENITVEDTELREDPDDLS